MPTTYPIVPGHEIVGRVSKVGSAVTLYKLGDINAYINLLRRDGNITLVGAPEKPLGVSAFGFIMGRRSLFGSNIGGIGETQEMLDFCGGHNVTADVEIIPSRRSTKPTGDCSSVM